MKKYKKWITLILAIIILVLVGLTIAYFTNKTAQKEIKIQAPAHQSQHTLTVAYSPNGKLSYTLVAEDVKYYSSDEVSWITKPVMTLFDENALEIWLVQGDKAKLTKNRILYLYGHVEANNLSTIYKVKTLKTESAQVNLITQDVYSDEKVTLYGTHFTSQGMSMHGNLRKKTANLINNVKTNYEIQNQKTILYSVNRRRNFSNQHADYGA